MNRYDTIQSQTYPDWATKSKGHLCFWGSYEYLLWQGDIYKSGRQNTINGATGYRNGVSLVQSVSAFWHYLDQDTFYTQAEKEKIANGLKRITAIA